MVIASLRGIIVLVIVRWLRIALLSMAPETASTVRFVKGILELFNVVFHPVRV